MNRRDLLKIFSAGTLIAPVVGGMPSQTQARLVEPPKIEPVEFKPLSACFPGLGEYDCVIYMRGRTGDRTTFSFDAHVLEFEGPRSQIVDVTSHDSIVRRSMTVLQECSITLKLTGSPRMAVK